MKSITIILFTLIFTSTGFSIGEEPNCEKEIQVNAKEVKGTRYFSLKIVNEDQAGFYVLVCNNQGVEDLIDVKDAIPNELAEPIWYSFVDDKVRSGETTYTLRHISSDSVEILAEWKFYSDEVTNQAAFAQSQEK